MENAEVSLHALSVPVPDLIHCKKSPAHYKLISWSVQTRVFQNC